jgi:oligopeptide transport system substrate-binding protein
MNKTKLIAGVAAVSAIALALSGCGNGGSSASGSASQDIVVNGCEPQNPLVSLSTNETCGGNPVSLLYTGLTAITSDGKTKLEIAKSITASNNNQHFDIKLKDWKFANGQTVKAENFTKAWSYGAVATNAQVSSSFFSVIKGYDDVQAKGTKSDTQLSGLKIVNDKEFTVDLNAPSSTFKTRLAYSAYAPLADSFFKNPKAYGQKPVASGAYKFDSWNHNQSIKVVKNPNYKGIQPAKNNSVTFKVYTDPQAAFSDVQAGNLDVIDTIPTSQTKTFRKDKSIQPYAKGGSVTQQMTILANEPHWDVNTQEGKLRRQAISMAINRKQVIDKVLNGLGTPAVDFLAPPIEGYSKDLKGKENLEFNPTKAKQLWAQADQISQFPKNQEIGFYYNADGGGKEIFDAIANQIKNNLGLNAKSVAVATFSQLRQQISQQKIHGFFRSGWQPDYPSAENYLQPLFSSAAADGNGSNDGNYKNAQFDKVLSQASSASSDDAVKLYQQAEEILLEDLPSIPLYNSYADGAAAKSVKGFTMNWQNEPVFADLTK